MNNYGHTFWMGLALFLTAIGGLKAQEQKAAYVNTDLILQEIPEYDGIQQQLRVTSQQWNDTLRQMKNEIEELKQEFEAKKILYAEQMRTEKQQQITRMIDARKQFVKQKFGSGGEYFQKQKELLEPVQRKVYEAIITVAQRLEIDFVYDRANNTTLLYANKRWNLNEEILIELGVTLNQ